MKNKWLQHILVILVSLSPLCYLAIIWPTVPAVVPVHFDGAFKPNGFASKQTAVLIYLGIIAVSLGSYFLMQYIHKIDPKRAAKPDSPLFNKLGIGIVVFIAALNFIIIRLSVHQDKLMEHALMPLLGLLFAFLGSIMHNIQPNYFAGIKLPWTLHSDYNWRKTHQLTGKLWVVCGILITILTLILPETAQSVIMSVAIPVLVVVPIVYSFILFKKEQANPEIANEENGN